MKTQPHKTKALEGLRLQNKRDSRVRQHDQTDTGISSTWISSLSIWQGVRNHVELYHLHFEDMLVSPVGVVIQKSIAYRVYKTLEVEIHQYSKKHRLSSAFAVLLPTMMVPTSSLTYLPPRMLEMIMPHSSTNSFSCHRALSLDAQVLRPS